MFSYAVCITDDAGKRNNLSLCNIVILPYCFQEQLGQSMTIKGTAAVQVKGVNGTRIV